jgi:hypothetical protein
MTSAGGKVAQSQDLFGTACGSGRENSEIDNCRLQTRVNAATDYRTEERFCNGLKLRSAE